jgi:endonuclease/exonuclease/phosphatase (EEP) superfamily protein YafD
MRARQRPTVCRLHARDRQCAACGRELERSATAATRAAGPATKLLQRLEAAATATGEQAEQASTAVEQARQQLKEAVAAQRCAPVLGLHAVLRQGCCAEVRAPECVG